MTKFSALEELQSAIRMAVDEADSKQTSRQIAAKFYGDHGELIRPFEVAWVQEKLASLLSNYRLGQRRAKDVQYQLGFRHMPKRIVMPSGKSVRRDQATIGVLEELAKQLRATKHRGLAEVENAIALMAKYRGKPDSKFITWAEVVEREAAKKQKASR
jgi:hypothetical protein